MSWDDEDFDAPTTKTTAPAAAASWEDEEEDEVLESWEIDEEEVARKKKEAEAQKQKEKAELKKKQEEAKAKKLGKHKVVSEFDDVDEATRKELLRKAELSADLNNAADLFGGLGVAGDDDFDINEHPREKARRAAAAVAARKPVLSKDTPIDSHPLFQPTNKAEFESLRKTLGPVLTDLAEDSLMNYSSGLAIDLIRDLAQPLSVENLRKVLSTLNVVIKDKERQERQNRLKKTGGTSTGGAGKKKAKPAARPNVGGGFKKDGMDELDDFDDFGDDDFM
ncbi:translation initiation factor eIF3 subunit [Suhomyces tanzawaensis NRRL Y-17324]|uniref:Eukaryotic translation initiation factor 3 subunit J n=1 Tax=Suhomyces tanzawaensis NRRL Y-17324 TaxID=984487 RepID=A0A1E4SJH0_9ASCO|nr:translation initiation factor eIF3 subunit [Suhomyces tanzawaensis NRRL Y-17324]ODV79582.1 translation initiation factor eIF3 subunit [Suhomyces tanzawaensis NRRL Y-17324]